MIDIIESFLTNNLCYIRGYSLLPKKIMLHSTACPGVPAENFISSWNTEKPNGYSVCVHGFLNPGKFYQALPFNMRGWHCGGSGNLECIGFEICEPKFYSDRDYFEKIKASAAELCVRLCKKFNISVNDITSHCEANRKYGNSYASNHADLDHWWKSYHNYTMDDFRAEVASKLRKLEVEEKMLQKLIDKYGEEAVENMLMKHMEAEMDDNIPSKWAAKEFTEAKELGITDGSNPKGLATREQVAVMITRAIKSK